MKKIYLVLAVSMVLLSGTYNTAIAGQVAYTDYGVTNEATLDSALTDTAHVNKRIDIDSNINLQNDLPASVNSNLLIINGNNKTIDGGFKKGFLDSATSTTKINDLTLKNFSAGTSATLGGVILNHTGSLNVYDSHFTNNRASQGSAIANNDRLNIYRSTFENNSASTSWDFAGAIYNSGTTNIYSSTFKNNTAPNYGYGAAIANMNGTASIYNSTFTGNGSIYGGAIYNNATLNVYNSTFGGNLSSDGNTATSDGGAIYNKNNLTIYDSIFKNNTATTSGGAIYTKGTAYVIADKSDVEFTNNTSTGNGGAIYNSGNLYLVANNGGITFTGNSATGPGNDIYNTGFDSKLYLNAGLGDITFNSGIYANFTYYTYINNPIASIDGLTVPTTGRVILNSPLTGAANIYLNNGMLKVGESGSIDLSSGELRLSGNSILNLANGNTENVKTGVLGIPTGATPSIWMDINPSDNTSDYFTTSGASNQGQPKFVLRILDDGPGNSRAFTGLNLNGINSYGYTNHYAYTFTGRDWGGFEYTRSGDGTDDGLANAIADTHDRSFSLVGSSDYTATSNLPTLSAGVDAASTKTLTVFGQGKNGPAISGAGIYSLFNVPQYAQLNIVDAFIKNSAIAGVWGPAINNAGALNVYDSLFYNNYAMSVGPDAYGGAIYNSGTAYIANSDFTENRSATFGGAIANNGASAIMNIYHSSFTKNMTINNKGGAISNTDGATLNVSDSTFGGDNSSLGNRSSLGGAIYNTSTANIYNSTFNNNQSPQGGAIYNNGTTNVYNSTFLNNIGMRGGAVSNAGGVVNLYNSTFTNNISTNQGGAIYSNNGTVNLIASGQDVTFSGNTATYDRNDIYLDGVAKLNLNASLGNKITFGGGIKSSAIANGIININKGGFGTAGDPPTGAPITGEVILGAPIQTSTVNLYGGTLTLNNDSYLNGNALTLAGGILNMQNGAVGTMALNSLAVTDTNDLKIDANLATGTSDKIDGTYAASTGKLNVSSIKLLNDSTASSASTQLLGSGLIGHNLVRMGVTKAYTPIYQYNVNYNDTTGQLTFNGGGSGGGGGSGNFNPAILNAPVSANVGAYMTQISTYNEALSRSELFMSLPQQERLLMKQRNMYANVGGNDVQPEVFSPTFLPDERGGIWFKQYTSFENVPMNNGPNVSNIGYGVMVGADSPMYHLSNGCDGYVTAYVGYNGSHQNYDNVGVNQNGGALGLTGTLYKGNFFTALTASVGDSYGQANTMYGVDNFNTLLAGLAWKSGYNIEMAKGKFILQPSLLAAYTFANTFDYTTASGVNMTSDPMNAIQIAPGVKFIANMENGWQPYLAANMVFNIMDNQKFQANDVQLPQMSIAPYIEYGLGVQRRWGERFTGFGQAMLRGGGRNGIALQFGFRIAIGK